MVNGATERQRESIFIDGEITDYCQLKCNDKPHTLCDKQDVDNNNNNNNNNSCTNYKNVLDNTYRTEMLNGHNGLRNRFSNVANIANMKMLVWDEELSLMAEMWNKKCQKYEKDPCTSLQKTSIILIIIFTIVGRNFYNNSYQLQTRNSLGSTKIQLILNYVFYQDSLPLMS